MSTLNEQANKLSKQTTDKNTDRPSTSPAFTVAQVLGMSEASREAWFMTVGGRTT